MEVVVVVVSKNWIQSSSTISAGCLCHVKELVVVFVVL